MSHRTGEGGSVRRLEHGAGSVVWRSWGDGPLLVLIHGGFGSWTHWARIAPHLAARRRVLAPDLPGYGDSDDLPEPHSAESLAATVAAGLETLAGGREFELAGFSVGAFYAARVARLMSGRVRRFHAVGPAGPGLTAAARPVTVPWRGLSGPELEAAHRRNLGAVMLSSPADAATLRLHDENVRRSRLRGRDIEEAGSFEASLRAAATPLTCIYGSRDVFAAGQLAARRALILGIDPSARFEILDGAGHWVQHEAPDRVARIMLGE